MLVWQGAPELLLQAARIDQFKKFFLGTGSRRHAEFLDSQWIHYVLSDAVDYFEYPLGIDDVKFVKSALEKVLKRLCHGLDELLGDFCEPHVLHVDDGDPVLDFPRDQSPRNDELNDVRAHVNQCLVICLDLLQFANIDMEYGSECSVAFVDVSVALVQLIHPAFQLRGLNGEAADEVLMVHQLLVCVLVDPLSALEETLDQSLFIIIADIYLRQANLTLQGGGVYCL